jgi:hypothetical protein
MMTSRSPEPTAVGAFRSAIADHVAIRLLMMSWRLLFAGAVDGLVTGAARDGFGQPDKLRDLANLLRKRFAGEFPAHPGFHNVGSFNLFRLRTSAK